jgi:translation elongation factor EF-G
VVELEIIVDRLRREFNIEAALNRPTVFFKVALSALFDGSYHDLDSSESALRIAAMHAFSDGVARVTAGS